MAPRRTPPRGDGDGSTAAPRESTAAPAIEAAIVEAAIVEAGSRDGSPQRWQRNSSDAMAAPRRWAEEVNDAWAVRSAV